MRKNITIFILAFLLAVPAGQAFAGKTTQPEAGIDSAFDGVFENAETGAANAETFASLPEDPASDTLAAVPAEPNAAEDAAAIVPAAGDSE